MENRLCKICGLEFKPKRWNSYCCSSECSRILNYNRNSIYQKLHKNEHNLSNKKYREKNKDKIRTMNKIYELNNKEKIKQRKKIYRIKHKERDKIYHKNKAKLYRKNNYLYVLKNNASRSIRYYLSKNIYHKTHKTVLYLGCSIEFLKQYLESQFKPWMNWNNYGKYNGKLKYGWDIDHIIPLSSAKTEEELIKLFHYTNLQPLDSYVNRHIKRDII